MKFAQFGMVAIVGMLVAVSWSGCITTKLSVPATVSFPPENSDKVPVTAITVTRTVTTVPIKPGIIAPADAAGLKPPTATGTPFITIDPISDKNTGDLVIISGTTNLPSGASVYLKKINESTGESTMLANNYVCPDAQGVNRWRFVYDSTDWMRPGRQHYLVTTPKGDVNRSVQFNLFGTFLGPEKTLYYESGSKSATISGTGAPYITVNPIGDRQTGDIFRISGTTNLIEGTTVYCTVWPVYFEDRSKRPSIISDDFCDGQFNVAAYSPAVVKGTGDTNRWSCPADMTIQQKNEMIVHVSTTDEYFTVREIFGNATFNLN